MKILDFLKIKVPAITIVMVGLPCILGMNIYYNNKLNNFISVVEEKIEKQQDVISTNYAIDEKRKILSENTEESSENSKEIAMDYIDDLIKEYYDQDVHKILDKNIQKYYYASINPVNNIVNNYYTTNNQNTEIHTIEGEKINLNQLKCQHCFELQESEQVYCPEHLYKEYKCKNCEYKFKIYSEQILHKYDIEISRTDPTCTNSGMLVMGCSGENCKQTNTVILPALGHNANENGICIKCGEQLWNNPGNYSQAYISVNGTIIENSNFIVTLNLPDNTFAAEANITVTFADGYVQKGRLLYIKEGPDGNAIGSNSIIFKARVHGNALITASDIVLCDKDANEIEKNGTRSYRISILKEQPQEHTHNYIITSETPPTCTTSGTIIRTCSCGETIIETLPAKGHNFAGGPICTVCGTANPNYVAPSLPPLIETPEMEPDTEDELAQISNTELETKKLISPIEIDIDEQTIINNEEIPIDSENNIINNEDDIK